ncbi:unnamed protein product [Mytilus edulis]|uniref:Uncharacterized protein n=1 Tax=Mytilus edulis TaxID=6550 RepID=A0A8S3QCQ8_MYTED|nr:unnamed protein product [Mytilus edulis]
MAVPREIKPPLKFQNCVTGNEFDECTDINSNNKYTDCQLEEPMPCHQVNGKTNNVTFRTLPEKIEPCATFWNRKNYLLKGKTVIKILCDCGTDKNCTIKINFYKTGSVVIQGAKCVQFSETYFETLKHIVKSQDSSLLQKSGNDDSFNDHSLSLDNTKIEQSTTGKNLQNENNLSDTSLTFAKSLANVNNTSTPIRKEGTLTNQDNQVETPKEKIAKHGQMLSSKLDTLTATLTTIDISFKLFVNKLTDLKNATDTIVPDIKGFVPELISSNQKIKYVSQQIENFDNKIKHCNQNLESIHLKINLLDTQFKESALNKDIIIEKMQNNEKILIDFREENNDSMEAISNKIAEFNNRISRLEEINTSMNSRCNSKESIIEQREKRTSESHTQNVGVSECDYLILSDSILRRIIPKKISPDGKTIKRYIRGGAETCSTFIEKNGKNIKPQHVLISIGTRDLQNNAVKNKEFENLFHTTTQIWPNAKIFVLPIIRRKDMPDARVHDANEILATECLKFQKITLIKKFEPTDEMFYDQVHLNSKQGLPEIVKHLKTAMNMYGNRPSRSNHANQQPIATGGINFSHRQPNTSQRFSAFDNSMDRPPPILHKNTMYPPWGQMIPENPQCPTWGPMPPGNPPSPPWGPMLHDKTLCPPWGQPPPNILPWQVPWLWQPYRQFNQVQH